VPSNPFTDAEWARHTVDSIDKWVGFVRDHTTKPVISIVRGVVYGVLIGTGLITIAVLFLIGSTRGVQAALDAGMARDTAVWLSYFIVGGVLLLIGLVIARKQRRDTNDSDF
jgi:uncharacterized membrane protein YedE/YeeE